MTKDENYYKYLNAIAKGLFNIIFRSGPIEEYHAEGRPIGDKEMEIINRFGFNRLGYMLDLFFSGEDGVEKFAKLCDTNAIFLSYFAPLDFNAKEVLNLEKDYELISKKD
ncbi:MAG: hypothetical protein WCY05_06985 [Candidatus Omnitrophota bacterium]